MHSMKQPESVTAYLSGDQADSGAMLTSGWKAVFGQWTLWVFAFSLTLSSAGISLAYGMALAFMVVTHQQFVRVVYRSPMLGLLLLLTCYAGIQGLVLGPILNVFPYHGETIWHVIRTVGLPVLVLGWVTYCVRPPIRILLLVAFVGFCVALLRDILGAEWHEIFDRSRLRLLRSPNELGLYGGVIVLASLLLFVQPVRDQLQTLKRWDQKGVLLLLCMTAPLSAAFGVFLSVSAASRAAWLGTVASLLVLSLSAAWMLRRHEGNLSSLSWFGIGFLVFTLIVAFASADTVRTRWMQEADTITALMEGQWDDLPRGSVSERVAIWRDGFARLQERPVFGWGGGALVPLIENAAENDYIKEGRGHYHNLYLQLALALGVPAMFVWLWVLICITITAYVYRIRDEGRDIGLAIFYVSWFALFMIASLFQVRMHSTYGAALFVFFNAIMLGDYLRYIDAKEAKLGYCRAEKND